ncbi:hypothetical protein BU17DRAFT_43697 [Hysterangium stoloniferum]|nr:hypothetical protein BU17DRAFT_43697 [Hysterangium stoloniferum]
MDVGEWSLPVRTPKVPKPRKSHKNGHLKGRKRYTADLKDLIAETPFHFHRLELHSVRAGDEEESVELIIQRDGAQLITLHLLINDSSSYPHEHTFISFAQDPDIPPHILQVVENMATSTPKSLIETVKSLMASLSESYIQGKYITQDEIYIPEDTGESHDDASDSDDGSHYEEYIDYDDHISNDSMLSERFLLIKEQFIEIIAAGFKPGITRLSDSELVLSVSCPIPSLKIPPRALVAWDRRLLQSYNNLTLLISGIHSTYPVLLRDGTVAQNAMLRFHVGLSPQYKPSKEVVLQKVRNFNIKSVNEPKYTAASDAEANDEEEAIEKEKETNVLPPRDPGCFDSFSLSSSMESVLDTLSAILQLRLKFHLGWAGAETLYARIMQMQKKPEDVLMHYRQEVAAADSEEMQLRSTYSLPPDPIANHTQGQLNLPLIAYCYLVRRFTLCPRYCLVCHRKIATNFEALKPYVCDDKLCTYQYFALNFGPSIEYEICTNPKVVDLLVSLTYVSANEGQLSEGLPIGLGLRVPPPKALPTAVVTYACTKQQPQALSVGELPTGPDGMVEFDALNLPLMQAAIVEMLNRLPPIAQMKEHLECKIPGKASPQLRTMDDSIPAAAWALLRWCVASSTAYLEEIEDSDELVYNISSNWRQFRFSVGAPDKEARFQAGLTAVSTRVANACKFPVLYGFHGSALKNWHSIIRQGLLIKTVVNGRAYGDGIYFAKDGGISMGHYAQVSSSRWINSDTHPVACVALAEIVNAPAEFTSNYPYYVVQHVDWVLCRYLLVKQDPGTTQVEAEHNTEELKEASYIKLDPVNTLTLANKAIRIPEQSYKLQMLLAARKSEQPQDESFDDEDAGMLSGTLTPLLNHSSVVMPQGSEANISEIRKAKDDWQHKDNWCDEATYELLPPPTDSSPRATLTLQKELRAMLTDQEHAMKRNGLTELGWYMPPELMDDNLFRWMIELHSFDPALPIAKDMVSKKVPSLLFEVRFPGTFPIQPPFFRIVKPRFLPFSQGGGGHITAGGSICMDLLVSDGWLPSYSISAILLQIKLAISNLDPRPARLANNWDVPYTSVEALKGFRRAAGTHGWTVPEGLDKLVR